MTNVNSIATRIRETQAAPISYTEPTTGIEMVLVRGGCYKMGDTFGDGIPATEKPVHEVCVIGITILSRISLGPLIRSMDKLLEKGEWRSGFSNFIR